MLKPEDVNMVIAHGNCPDGQAAAWTAWTMHHDNIEYEFVGYAGTNKEKLELPDVAGKNVLMVDFAYKSPAIMNILNSDAKQMLLLDHHKGAKKALDGKINCDYIFDMNRSGARMAWDYFYPNNSPPHIISYIEDRDIWKWDLPESRAYLAALDSYPMDFETYSWIASLAGDRLDEFFAEGRAIMRFQQHLVNNAIKYAVLSKMHAPDGSSYLCKVVNATSKEIISDVGNQICEEHIIGATWTYSHKYDEYIISLRSKGDIDVSEIAAKFGGGGHHSAAGCQYKGNIKDLFEMVEE